MYWSLISWSLHLGRNLGRNFGRFFSYNTHGINEIDIYLGRICVFAYIFVTNAIGTAKNALSLPSLYALQRGRSDALLHENANLA